MGGYSSNLGNFDPDGNYPSAASPLDIIEELLKARAVSQPPPRSWAAWPREQLTANSSQPAPAEARPSGKDTTSRPAGATPGINDRAAPDYSSLALAELDKGSKALDVATETAQTQPDTSKLDAADKRIAELRTPTQLRQNRPEGDTGVGTGEMLANYKPTGWQRVGRGVKSGVIGLLTGGIPGAAIGALEPGAVPGGKAYGAPNSKYEQAEADREATLGNLTAERPEMSERLKTAIAARKAKVDDFSKLGQDRTKNAEGVTGVLKGQNESPEGKGAAAGAEQRQKDAAAFTDRQQRWRTVATMVTPTQMPTAEAQYLLTGALPNPREPRQPSAEEIALAGALARWRQDNGGKNPNYDQFVGILGDVRGKGAGGGQDEVSSLVAEATGKKQEFFNGYTHRADGYWMKKGALLPAETNAAKKMATGDELLDPDAFKQKLDQFRLDANTKLAQHGAQINEQGTVVKDQKSASQQPAAQATPAAQAAPARKAPPPGATHVAKGSDGKDHYTDGKKDLGAVE